MHSAHAVVGAEDRAKEAAAQVELHGVCLDGELLRLAGEVAKDDQDWVSGRDVLWLPDHDEDVLVVAIDGEVLAGVDGAVAVMEFDELAVPVKKGVGVCVFQSCVGDCICFGFWWWGGFPFWWRWRGVPGDDGCGRVCRCGVGGCADAQFLAIVEERLRASGEEDGGQKFGDGEILFPIGVAAHAALEARPVGGEQRNAVAGLRDVFRGLDC